MGACVIFNNFIRSLENRGALILPGPELGDQPVLRWALKHFGIGHRCGTAEENIVNGAMPFERGDDICRVLCFTCEFVRFRFGQVCAVVLVLSRDVEGTTGTWRVSVFSIGFRPSQAVMIAPFCPLVEFSL